MGRRLKQPFNIGDKFLTWIVQERIEPKNKYRYKCVCEVCGATKEFNKYSLLKGKYTPCRACVSQYMSIDKDMKRLWNCTLNGFVLNSIRDISITKKYWFLCEHGHNYKASYKNFKATTCPVCSNNQSTHPCRIEAYEIAYKFFSKIYGSKEVTKEDNFILVIEPLELAIAFYEEDRYTSYSKYYKNETEFINDATLLKQTESGFKKLGFKFNHCKVPKSFKKSVDDISSIVLQCVYQQTSCF